MLLRNLCCSLVLCVWSLSSFAQSNPCGVKAVMNPNVTDSILTGPTTVLFQSASINATSFRFLFDHYEMTLNQSINWGLQPGLTTVRLVAYNGNCTDTATAYYFWAGNFPTAADNPRRFYGYPSRTQFINDLSAHSNGYLISGYRDYWFDKREPQQGLLIKTKQEGCVEWARKLVSEFPLGTNIKTAEAGPGDITYALATVINTDYIIKLDGQGEMLWSKTLNDIAGNTAIYYGIKPMADGGVVVTGMISGEPKPLLIRLNSDGSIRWQHKFEYNLTNAGGFKNICLKDGYIYAGGTIGHTVEPLLTKVDDLTGATIWTRKYSSPNGILWLDNIVSVDSTLLFGFTTATAVANTPSIGGFMRLDTSGNILFTKLIGETYVPNTLVGPYGGNSSLIQSGKDFYIISAGAVSLSLQPGISYYTKIVRIDSNYNVAWVKSWGGAGTPRFYYAAPAPNDGFAMGGNENGSVLSPNQLATLIAVKVIDSAGGNPNGSCFLWEQPPVIVQPPILKENTSWLSDVSPGLSPVDASVPIQPFYPEMRFKCPDYVDSCSYLKLSGPRSVCNITSNHTIVSHKNTGCGQPTQWKVPPAVQIINQTDTSITIHLPAFGRYVIYGTNPLSCVPVEDSLVIEAAPIIAPPDLGADREICPQNSLVLHAGPSYFSYLWSDGSTDSLLTVTQPGQYWIRVVDSCDNIFADTIEVNLAPPIPLSIGADRQICPRDTITLQATAGFMNYQWSPAYNISSTNTLSVQVSPLVDTTYTLIAEKTPGCFAYDTIRIGVFTVPLVDLGNDREFCMGDSAVFDAGPGFANYTWSNGSTMAQSAAYTAGVYSVLATTSDGCHARDTVRVLQVFALPAPQLDPDPVLCIGETKTLDAGAGFASYQWNTGSTSQTIPVSAVGIYSVEVTDTHGCKGEAQTSITRIQALPAAFLGPDTAICSYGNLVLKPLNNFRSYLWNNGSTQSSITITAAGQYWLQVKDAENCEGRDSVVVVPKQCLKGLYAPTGFTPNGDGLNDLFRISLFGDIKQYRFTIYNRWGTIVFQSNTPGQGWNGRLQGVLQDSAVFTWTCSYQLEGEPARMEKGTVMLIR